MAAKGGTNNNVGKNNTGLITIIIFVDFAVSRVTFKDIAHS